MPPEDRPYCLGRCGRRLSNPDSIALGYGRTCAERHGITSPPSPARMPSTGPVPHVPGQTELPLNDQPDLWSTE